MGGSLRRALAARKVSVRISDRAENRRRGRTRPTPDRAHSAAMASISHDGQSFTINGRRRWLTIAALDYARLPRSAWRDRIRTTRQAGFNTVLVSAPWSLHEPSKGKFEFSDHLDVRAFIETLGDERMFVILRPGPFIGDGWDAGGLPGWLIDGQPQIVRTGDPLFKEAIAKWFSALFDQVKSLQLTSAGAGGPIILIQNEHAWFRGDEAGAATYIGETARFLRESGARVPLFNANNLFASAEGEIDAWLGDADVFTTSRQLRAVRPDAPPMILDIPLAPHPGWGEKPQSTDARTIIRTLASCLSSGGQFGVNDWCAGVLPGFSAGRDPRDETRYLTSVASPAAPVTHAGDRSPVFHAIKRVATFASSFDRVLANLEFADPPIAVPPDDDDAVSVISMRGSQGGAVFLAAPEKSKTRSINVSLPNGQQLTVPLQDAGVSWLLTDTSVGRRAVLDYCNMAPWANVGDVLVCFGPSGAQVELSVNGAAHTATVPSGKSPAVIEYEHLTIIVCSEELIDVTCATEDAVFIGCAGVDEEGQPIPADGYSTCHKFVSDGAHGKITIENASPKRRRPALKDWSKAPNGLDAEAGEGARWTAINEPALNAKLGSANGYIWLRCDLRFAKAHRSNLGFYDLNDRAHVFVNNERLAVVDPICDAASLTLPLALGKGEHTFAVLIDHFGRPSGGAGMGVGIGLAENLWSVKAFRLNKPKLVTAEPIAPVAKMPGRLWDMHDDEFADPRRIEWSFTYRRLAPLYFSLDELPASALMLLNDEPIAWLTPGGPRRMRLPEEPLRRGGNVLQLVVMGDSEAVIDAFEKSVSLHEGTDPLSKDNTWAWAPWEAPPDDAFTSVTKSDMKKVGDAPTWWRATFTHSPLDAPIAVDPSGLSKGQILVNGHNLGRYVASINGRKVSTTLPVPIPSDWLHDDGNELIIFDEYGASPSSCKLVWTD